MVADPKPWTHMFGALVCDNFLSLFCQPRKCAMEDEVHHPICSIKQEGIMMYESTFYSSNINALK